VEEIEVTGEEFKLTSPVYTEDIALLLRAHK
jgi:hypothetical protein